MCGRYAASKRPEELVEEFEIEVVPPQPLAPSWNIAPTQPIYAIAEIDHRCTLLIVRWGLIPSWARDPKIAAGTVNARVESVALKPAFRSAFKSRRCLIPADGYYEWYQARNSSGATSKQPFYLHRKDGRSLAMAGLYEYWTDPSTDSVVTSATIITTKAKGTSALIHDRMPALLSADHYGAWLDPNTSSKEELLTLLALDTSDQDLIAQPVSRLVNSVRNNGAELIEPIPLAGQSPLL